MDRKLFISVCVAAIGLFAVNAGAQEPRVMNLHDCMEYAISNSTKMRIQQAAVGDAQIDRRDAALALFTPQISANTYAYYNFGRSIDPQTNTYFNTTSFHNNYGVSAGYDLFDGFKAVNNYKISKTGLLIADSQEKQVEADICLAVMEAYYNVVYYKRLVDVYEEQVSVAEQALVKARRQEELGQKGHADVVQMEADLADRQYDLTNTRNMYESQRMTLADLMFWPLDEELVIDASMPVWQAEQGVADEAVSFALEHNPAVKIASMQELNAKREKMGDAFNWDEAKKFLSENFGFWGDVKVSDEQTARLERSFKELQEGKGPGRLAGTVKHVISECALIGWQSGGHSNGYVPAFAIGVGAEQFHGRFDNTEICKKMAKAAGWEVK